MYIDIIVCVIETYEGLKKTDEDNHEESKEDYGLLHHDFENDKHSSEEADGVQVE